jgi:hypothetical protein
VSLAKPDAAIDSYRSLVLLILSPSCAPDRLALTDQSAMDRLMSTNYVAELAKRNPSPILCYIEGSGATYRNLYLGEDHPTHTVRLRSCRVQSDGRVLVNTDPTLLEELWAPIE